MSQLVVIGAGLSGLTAAWRAAEAGTAPLVLAKGWGALHWTSGCIDVLGYRPGSDQPVSDPRTAIEQLIGDQPRHPYGAAGPDRLDAALTDLQDLTARSGYPLVGALDRNWRLPSGTGVVRPTCLAPHTMVAGDLERQDPVLVVGFRQLHDFSAPLVGANLDAQGISARDVTLDLPTLAGRRFTTTAILAGLFEDPAFLSEVAESLMPEVGDAARVGFPAVLGMEQPLTVHSNLERVLGRPVFEIPTLPPSVPGMRLQRLLAQAIESLSGRILIGLEVVEAETEDARVTGVRTEAPARRSLHRGEGFVLATGGILGGGILAGPDRRIREMVFDLPVRGPSKGEEWLRREFLDPGGHPIYRAGLAVDEELRPLGPDGVVLRNLRAVGGALGGADTIRERSRDGVALATGWMAGEGAKEILHAA